MNDNTHKTEVSGSSPEWPTKSVVHEELPIRQLFPEYYDIITNTHTPKSFYEAKRLLEQFRGFLGQVPPSTNLAVQFLTLFKDR